MTQSLFKILWGFFLISASDILVRRNELFLYVKEWKFFDIHDLEIDLKEHTFDIINHLAIRISTC